ncbi:MAG: glycerol-3-phosphate 1-O-acyltransferase PlsY [Ruminococcus sp.]|nr:glycerol-3-phosphate 1-O-acyltransferase PlsY [Ruminococcus sp.]
MIDNNVNFFAALGITALISYLLGSLNSAIIVCKLWKKTDIRTVGSKNAGLTNTLRVFGKGPALLTLLGDLSKGVVSVLIGIAIFNLFDTGLVVETTTPLGTVTEYSTIFVGYVAGIFAILGHIFPIYYGFKGGKGILVSCSILLVIDPITFCIEIPFFILVVILTRYVSVASISAAVLYPFTTCITQTLRGDVPYIWLNTTLVVITSILLIYMHRENIKRLRAGTENKFGKKKAKED